MKKVLIILIGIVTLNQVMAQDTLNIYQCFEAMESYYPKAGEKKLIREQTKYKVQNLRAEWLPSIDLNVQATYQSDVAQVEIDGSAPFPINIPSPSKDQYKATLDINQMIYDGGAVQSSKKTEQLNADI